MKAIAYNIQPYEKELLTLANGKRHELTLISNDLNDKTVVFAQGKQVVIVATSTVLEHKMMAILKRTGVDRVIVRSAAQLDPAKMAQAKRLGLQVVNTLVTADSPTQIAQKTIEYLQDWESEKVVKGTRGSELELDEDVGLVGEMVKCKQKNGVID